MPDISDTNSPAPPLLSIFILAAAALAYEVLLVRLFSIIHWHHFAFMVISIALLGYGASGSLITVFRNRLVQHYDSAFLVNTIMFGLSSIACFVVVQQLPFNALEIMWDSSQWLRLMLSYLLLTLPFFFVANVFALTMIKFHRKIPLIYGVDLIGAGTGAVLIMMSLMVLTPETILRLLGLAGLAAGLSGLHRLHEKQRLKFAALTLSCMLAVMLIPRQWLELTMSEYKGLSGTLLVTGARTQLQHSSPLSMIDVVDSPVVPFRNAPGLSLQSPVDPPQQLAVFMDGDEMVTIDRQQQGAAIVYHDYMSSALPYHIHDHPQRALILKSATGAGILQAYAHDVKNIDAVEPDEELSRLITRDYAGYFGWADLQSHVNLYSTTPRSFVARAHSSGAEPYDAIIMGPPGGSSGGAAGVHALATSYDFTVEALSAYLELLEPDGLLSITQWTSNPARGNLKLFITAVTAMKNAGIKNPENHIAWLRSWNTATLVVKKSALTEAEINRTRQFCQQRSFDLAWLPGIQAEEANRYHILHDPVYYLVADSMFNDPEMHFIEQYKYNIDPATDNSPYFDNFFTWSIIPELMSLPGRAGISLVGVGYPTLMITLVQAIIASFILILLPLLLVKKRQQASSKKRGNVVIYFLAIGLAFLFIELAFIQKFSLIIGQPLYAVAVVLCAFLVFSGLGSLYVEKQIAEGRQPAKLLKRSVFSIAAISLLYVFLLPVIASWVMSFGEVLRFLAAFAIAAPLAFAMGMPFPTGLSAVQNTSPEMMPWAWSINGCASVLSAIIAVLLAIHIGFSGVMLCAAVLYLIAWRSQV